MPDFKRATRVARLLRKELSDIITLKSNDPLIGLVAITYIKLTDDLKSARVYVRMIDSNADREQSLRGLGRASKWIRTELGRRMELKYVPRLTFVYDEAADRAQNIESLLDKINRESGEALDKNSSVHDS
jgi:ribosome-binding factor A